MASKAQNGKLSRRFTVRFSEANMARLHAYTTQLQQKSSNRVTYSQALARLIEALPSRSLSASTARGRKRKQGSSGK